jgi:hypothetical protein
MSDASDSGLTIFAAGLPFVVRATWHGTTEFHTVAEIISTQMR